MDAQRNLCRGAPLAPPGWGIFICGGMSPTDREIRGFWICADAEVVVDITPGVYVVSIRH